MRRMRVTWSAIPPWMVTAPPLSPEERQRLSAVLGEETGPEGSG